MRGVNLFHTYFLHAVIGQDRQSGLDADCRFPDTFYYSAGVVFHCGEVCRGLSGGFLSKGFFRRRSRERLKDGDKEAKQTLYFVLKTLVKLLAPFTPFVTEYIWLKLRDEVDEESVHLTSWPQVESFKLFGIIPLPNLPLSRGRSREGILEYMKLVRQIVSLGLEARQKAGIKVRQPLSLIKVKNLFLNQEYLELIKDELNVKEIICDKHIETEIELDTKITEDLKKEGNYRELVRALQDMRKKLGLTPSDAVLMSVETDDVGKKLIQNFENDLKKTVLVSKIEFKANDGEEIKIEELKFKVKIEK